MIDIFEKLSKLLRYRRIHIDGNVFRLHYTLTVIILMSFCIVVTTKQIAGDPIDCDQNEVISKSLLNTYCFIHSTYTVKTAIGMKIRGIDGNQFANPGIGLSANRSDRIIQVYYQWVWFILFFEAICFYFPRWLWKVWESDKMSSLVSDLNYFKEQKTKKIGVIVEYLIKTEGKNDLYAIKYFVCELLALLNVLAQMAFINAFLDGEFLTYGFDVIKFAYIDPEIRSDPMNRVSNFSFDN